MKADPLDQIMEHYEMLIADYETRIAELESPWTRIDPADPGTLPPYLEKIIVTSKDGAVESGYRKAVMYGVREIDIILHEDGDWTNLEDCLAWQPWPDPAPYPNEETPWPKKNAP
jgi:hypothetical protein